jgi:hypothetical protein
MFPEHILMRGTKRGTVAETRHGDGTATVPIIAAPVSPAAKEAGLPRPTIGLTSRGVIRKAQDSGHATT